MNNLIKFIKESEPENLPHVMLAVDHKQVRVWQLRTINQHEVITGDYGGAYWLNCWTRLSQPKDGMEWCCLEVWYGWLCGDSTALYVKLEKIQCLKRVPLEGAATPTFLE